MTLQTSLVIAGDADGAVDALHETDGALTQSAAKAQQLSSAYATADKAIERLAGAQSLAKTQTNAAKAAFEAGEISLKDYNARLLETKTALSLVEAGHRNAVGAIKQLTTANQNIGPSLGQARAGYTNLTRQIQDVAVMASMPGVNIGTIITTQGGQVADAVAQMGGRFAGLAKFMSGPYGTALILITGLGLNLAQSMWEQSKAAEENGGAIAKVELASNGLRDAQSVLGEIFDLTTGKIKAQNEMLLLNARLTAVNLRAEAVAERAQSQRTLGFDQSGLGLSSTNRALGMLGIDVSDAFGRSAAVRDLAGRLRSGKVTREAALGEAEKLDFSGLKITKEEFLKAIVNDLSSTLKEKTASAIESSIESGKLDPVFAKPETKKKGPRGPSEASIAEFGEDTGKRIANMIDQFSDLPGAVEKANKALRELDDIASDLDRKTKKPANIDELTRGITKARAAIEQSLLKPFNDYLDKSREAAEIDKLLIAGRYDEAEALKVVLALKDRMKPLDQEQLNAVLATVQGERQRALVLRDQRALIDANIRAVWDMRGALEQTVADALRGRFSIDNVLNSLASSYINITSQRIVERMFGDTLRSIESQATGAGKVDAAATSISTSLSKGASAVDSLTGAIERAIPRIDAATSGAPAPANDNGAANDNGDGQDIIVTGKRSPKLAGQDPALLLVNMVDGLARDIGLKIPREVGDGVKSVLSSLEKRLPDVLGGAITGASASRIVLGDRGTGGTIGSAIGGVLGQKAGEKLLGGALSSISSGLGSFAGPIGSALGGIVGGLIGGLFKKAPSAGTVVSDTTSPVTATGNSDASKQAVSSVGQALQSGLKQIVQQLGGDLGSFAVSIGQREDYYRVATGSTDAVSAKHPERGTGVTLLYNGTDANAALQAAIADAIAQGAVKGLSEKVQKALKSSTDIDAALAEALKVQNLELALGGVGAALQKEFRTYEATAKERLRLATAYGFDIVKVEELNARERLALSDKLLQQQVGSLQSLIDEITGGSLFEGSSVDRRTALLGKIATTKAEADAGKEGAADTLAKLLQDFNAVSKEVYGTTGGFAADQTAILDAARDTIAKANARVAEAQKAVTDPALEETNRQLDESNDQLAKIAAALGTSVDYLKQIAANSNSYDYSGLSAMAGY